MHPSQKMTRKERRETLSGMWGDMPLNQFGISDDGKFFAWQGKISALLSFNPQLQSEFRDAIKPVRLRTFRIRLANISQCTIAFAQYSLRR